MVVRFLLPSLLAILLAACATPPPGPSLADKTPADTPAIAGVPPAPTADPRAALIDAVLHGDRIFRLSGERDIQHIQSGMLCSLPAEGDASRLIYLHVFPGAPPGDDIACDYAFYGGKLTLYATRNNGHTAKAVVADTSRFIEDHYPGARRVHARIPAGDGVPAIEGAAYDIAMNGRPARTKVLVALHGGWIIKIRASFPADQDQAVRDQAVAADLASSLWLVPVLLALP